MTLWPVAQILEDLACHLGLGGAQVHYSDALAIAEQARADLWVQAATCVPMHFSRLIHCSRRPPPWRRPNPRHVPDHTPAARIGRPIASREG